MNIAIGMAVAASIGSVDLNFQATSKSDKAQTALSRSLALYDRPSEHTIETLTQQGLNKRYKSDPAHISLLPGESNVRETGQAESEVCADRSDRTEKLVPHQALFLG